MNRRGFTLIEVLVTVLLIVVISLLVTPMVRTMVKESKNKSYNNIITTLEDAAKSYTYMNTSIIDNGIDTNGYVDISLLTLQESGLLKTELEDPRSGDTIPNTNTVRITKKVDSYIYEYLGSQISGTQYNLTVNLNGGSTTQVFRETYVGGSTIRLKTPSKSNYKFVGWTVSGGTIIGDTLTMGNESTTITAEWELNPTLTVNLDGGSTIQVFEETYESGFTIKLNEPTRTNYMFTGWSVSGGTITNNVLTIGNSNTTITAEWETLVYQIEYELNGGEMSNLNPAITSYNRNDGDITLNNPIKVGHAFVGWTGSNGANGDNAEALGGEGQGDTTREFGESTGTLYSTGGLGGERNSTVGTAGSANTGDGGKGNGAGTQTTRAGGAGGSGIVVIRNIRS